MIDAGSSAVGHPLGVPHVSLMGCLKLLSPMAFDSYPPVGLELLSNMFYSGVYKIVAIGFCSAAVIEMRWLLFQVEDKWISFFMEYYCRKQI